MKVLVTDGSNRVALAVVRALGQAGARVTVVEQERFARRTPPAFVSRFAARRKVLPSLDKGDAFLDALAAEARDADVLLPVSTNVLLACARARGRFPARLPVPPVATLQRANNKSSVLAVARKAGVPVPVSYDPESEEELEEVLSTVRYPAIAKLRDDEGTYLAPGDRYVIARTADELRAGYRKLHRVRTFPVVQELLVGDGYGVGILAREGRVLASFCHRRVREYPISGGPSAVCESVRDDRLAGYAESLVRELGWTGVAMAEFKKADDYRLLEVNPRFWGSLPLATRAGVNFPHLLCRMATGEDLPPAPAYREGVKLRFLALDFSAAWSALAAPERRGRYVRGFFRDLLDLGVKDGIFETNDLRPSATYLWNKLCGE